jgi:hypothetical protein
MDEGAYINKAVLSNKNENGAYNNYGADFYQTEYSSLIEIFRKSHRTKNCY